ncbi:MAG: hypothetical protein JNK82_39995 [Myxococcaceae bacterium]|nr:hypothetical protein [Myxococcaceae bacterium]
MSAHRLLSLAAALFAAGCTGLIDEPAPALVPVGVGEIDDTPRCRHEVMASAPTDTWTKAGPPGASVHALLPLGQGTLLVGTGLARSSGVMASRSAAIYRSTDSGRTVTRVLDLRGATVTSLVEAGTRVLAGTVGDGAGNAVYESTDRGLTFTPASTGLHTGARVVWLSVAPGTPARVYALVQGTAMAPQGAATTLYRRDGTGDWQLLAAAGLDPDPGGPLGAITADLVNRDRLYAVDGARLYRSDDAGATFTALATRFYGPPSGLANPRRLLATPSGLLIATVEVGVLSTADEGATFSELIGRPIADLPAINALATSTDGVLIGTRGEGLLRSGSTAPIGDCLLDRVVVTVASEGTNVWAGTNGGLQLSTDGARTFETVGRGLDEVVGRFTVAEVEGVPTAFFTSSAGLYLYTAASGRWQRQGDWAQTIGFSDVSVARGGELAFLSVDEELYPGRYGVKGSVWQWRLKEHKVSQLPGIEDNVGAVAADPTRLGAAFAYQRAGDTNVTNMTGVLVRASGAMGFERSPLSSSSLSTSSSFRFAPLAVAADGTVYAGARLATGTPVLLKSSDKGATSAQVWAGSGWVVYGVYVGPDGAVYLTGSQGNVGIRKSVDQGATFAAHDDGLSSFGKLVYALGFGPNGALLAGTEDGVHLAANGTTFTALNTGLERVPVWSVTVLPAAPRPIVLAGTAQGVYWRTLP